jgi:hypothetical protein
MRCRPIWRMRGGPKIGAEEFGLPNPAKVNVLACLDDPRHAQHPAYVGRAAATTPKDIKTRRKAFIHKWRT